MRVCHVKVVNYAQKVGNGLDTCGKGLGGGVAARQRPLSTPFAAPLLTPLYLIINEESQIELRDKAAEVLKRRSQ
uniref:Uncharacterized protein n=1 Tax=Helianthus annuus TaxID=4232 RepID=A0A251UJT2_HELAN